MVVYFGNKNTKEVHYLPNLKANCKINEIKSEHKKYFNPDTLDQAHREGFDNCAHCIGGLKR